MRFSRQEYWNGLPCPPPGDLPAPGIEPASLTFPALAVGSLPLMPTGKPHRDDTCMEIMVLQGSVGGVIALTDVSPVGGEMRGDSHVGVMDVFMEKTNLDTVLYWLLPLTISDRVWRVTRT